MFCKILRVALGLSQDFPYTPTEEEWKFLYLMAYRQTLLGVAYNAIERLPKESQPPLLIALRWSRDAEAIRGKNILMNQEAAHYTQLFAEKGFRSAILKGQANARLYPDPYSRQPGDIDIWVPGEYDKTLKLLQDLKKTDLTDLKRDFHDIAFTSENNINIEVHYKPSAIIRKKDNEFQKVLLNELEDLTLTPEGFYTPNTRFALLMQLAHVHKHSLESGIGFRQYMDYFLLLTHSTEADRNFAWTYAKKFGMHYACAAIMGVLELIFGLSREKMLCKPSRIRGKHLYKLSLKEGNFGFYKRTLDNISSTHWYKLKSWFTRRTNEFYKIPIDPPNMLLKILKYWKYLISSIPERIRRRSITL